MPSNIETRSMIAASGFFLCEYLPDDFESWEEEALDEFVEFNVAELFEGLPAKYVLGQIADLATVLVKFHQHELLDAQN